MKFLSSFLSIFIFLILLQACSDNPTGNVTENRPPEITNITANPDTVLEGLQSQLTCIANDPNNDELEYNWVSDSGAISGSGSTVTWTAPSTCGIYLISCEVDDGNGGTCKDSVSVFVEQKLPTEGLIAYWPFSGNANDVTLNSNHGIVNGAILSLDRFGNESSSYSFDGTDDYIDCGNDQSFNLKDAITISAWVSLKSYLNAKIVTKWKTESGWRGSWSFCVSDQGKPYFAVTGDGWSGEFLAISDEIINLDEFYHVLGSFSTTDNKIRIYVNGVKKGDANAQSGSIFISDAKVLIGAARWYSNGYHERYLEGIIDDIRIYDRILSSEEINALYYEGCH